jgi:ubiquinone/menaquinone biosynthesis C-methylase UbiE
MSERSGWQLASGSVAEAYDRYMMSAFGNSWAQALVQAAAPDEGDRVLDVACGTGAVARYAAAHVGTTGQVVGLDLNGGMLARARAMPVSDGISITWREGNATALPFPDASFDVVCCHQGLQFFPDHSMALREMFRCLVPAGRLALGVWRGLEHHPFYAALTNALQRYVGEEAAASLRAAFTLADADKLRSLVAGAGFRNIRIRIRSRLTRYPSLQEYVLGYLSGSPMAGAVAALNDTARTAMVEHVCTSLQAYVDDDGMAAPWEAHLVTGQT